MSLTWPWALLALLAFPLLLGYRWWLRRRRRREAVRVSSVALIRAALPGRSLWRRRIPLILFAVGLVVLGTGAARPQASVLVPSDSATILLAMDVSASMCSTDVSPNRITAAQNAARDFVKSQDGKSQIGLVTFSGIAGLIVPPTKDTGALLKAIDGLRTARGTAIGQAILTSVDAISEINPQVQPTGVQLPAPATAMADFQPDTIVVLTDGRNTDGVDPVTAATQAAARHVRVYTIGFGTANPSPMVCPAAQISGDAAIRGDGRGFGGGFGGYGGGRYQQIDEATLTKVASLTGGKYFQAKDAKSLSDVLRDLPGSISLTKKHTEVTMYFALAGALLVLVAVGLSQWWNRVGLNARRHPSAASPSDAPGAPLPI
jgi:Ca-activated chloride channel family protein